MSRLPELLAPAGSPEAARAALQYGADAIYLGLPEFSARAEAENFTWESLDEITAYAHAQARPRKVYVAMNTLLLTRELDRAQRVLQQVAEVQVDALIVQDAGLIRLARLHVPTLPLHASTQMTVHSVDGVRALARLGFTRVVPARELTLDEVGHLVRAGGLEVEIFVHGTLCYAYSGQCLFSSHATGRSGNRGRCTYGCRTVFAAGAKDGLPFSMKDLALGDHVQEVQRLGVASLKIEGRMKSPLYVAAVTDYYRRLLDGTLTPDQRLRWEEDLRTIFSRPWTDLHARGRQAAEVVIDGQTSGHRGARIGQVQGVRPDRDGDWLEFVSSRALEIRDGLQLDLPGESRPYGFGVDGLRVAGRKGSLFRVPPGPVEVSLPPGHPPIPAGAPVYCSSSQEVKRRYPVETLRPGVYRTRHPVDLRIQLRPDALNIRGVADLPVLGPVSAAIRLDGPFSAARQPGGTPGAAQKAFARLGDTPWVVHAINVEDPASCFVPASSWNEARRQLAEALSLAHRAAREQWAARMPPLPPGRASGSLYWTLRLEGWPEDWTEADAAGADEIVVSLGRPMPPAHLTVRAALPLLIREDQAGIVSQQVSAGLAAGIRRWEVSSLAGLQILRACTESAGLSMDALEVSGDWPLQVLNPQASLFYADLGVRYQVTSPEEEAQNLGDLLGSGGGRLWVLAAQFSPLFIAATGPAGPRGATRLFNRGREYVEVAEPGQHTLVARSPFWLAHQVPVLQAQGAAGIRVDLARASAAGADMRSLWKAARAGEPWPGSHEGNYRRGLR